MDHKFGKWGWKGKRSKIKFLTFECWNIWENKLYRQIQYEYISNIHQQRTVKINIIMEKYKESRPKQKCSKRRNFNNFESYFDK